MPNPAASTLLAVSFKLPEQVAYHSAAEAERLGARRQAPGIRLQQLTFKGSRAHWRDRPCRFWFWRLWCRSL